MFDVWKARAETLTALDTAHSDEGRRFSTLKRPTATAVDTPAALHAN